MQQCSKYKLIRTPHDHFPTVYNLLSERYSYPNAPSMTVIPAFSLVIPAKAGIHCGRRSAPPSRSDPQTTYYPFSDQARNVTYIQHISRQTKTFLLYRAQEPSL